jgi:hypothetical protein
MSTRTAPPAPAGQLRRTRRRWVLVAAALAVLAALAVPAVWGSAWWDRVGHGATAGGGPGRPRASSAGSAALLPVSYWEHRYLDWWHDEPTVYLPMSGSADSWDQYNLAAQVDGNTAMYRATGRTRYLDRALRYITNVVASARLSSSLPTSQYRDGYLGWVSHQPDLDPPESEVPLYESYFWRYATTMLRVIGQTPALYRDPAYRGRYDRLLRFAEDDVFEKWYARGAADNIYRSRTHMAAHWAMIALNLSLLTAEPDRRARYRTVVDNIDLHLPNYPSSLRGQLRDNPADPAAYFWSDEWGSTHRPGQDVGHGNGVVAYVVEAHDATRGAERRWTSADLARFTELLLAVVWPRDDVHRGYVDGSGDDNGWIADGFVKLGRYSAAAQRRLDRYPVVNDGFAANMALNARILSGGLP